jgi:hypothetical protein
MVGWKVLCSGFEPHNIDTSEGRNELVFMGLCTCWESGFWCAWRPAPLYQMLSYRNLFSTNHTFPHTSTLLRTLWLHLPQSVNYYKQTDIDIVCSYFLIDVNVKEDKLLYQLVYQLRWRVNYSICNENYFHKALFAERRGNWNWSHSAPWQMARF